MSESRIIKSLITISLLLALFGGLMFAGQGWLTRSSLLANILESSKDKVDQLSVWKLLPKIAGFGEEKTYLLLFQNNLELRPGGGYLGNFGILRVKNGKPTFFQLHDTNIFDGFGRVQTDPPKAIKDYLNVVNWQMRDGNWSPDFKTSALQVEEFYHAQGGGEKFDGIIAINATVLPELLKITGPIYLEQFDKEFKSDDVLIQLEYEVEKAYVDRGIDPGDRKIMFKALTTKVFEKILAQDFWQQNELKDLVVQELDKKNILLFLKDSEDQDLISKFNWSGEVNQIYEHDYLMIVEANLASKKSNAFVSREVEYSVDLSKDHPEALLKITYTHQGTEKDWFSDDYGCYLRVYTPKDSWLLSVSGVEGQTDFSTDLGKTVFGNWIKVLTGQEKVVELRYRLPEKVRQGKEYKLLVQKQSGIDSLPFKFNLKDINQREIKGQETIENDWEGVISFEE